jgi:uncharacterized protein (DUF488 family)
MLEQKTIWTIGHSTRLLEEFIEILRSFDIELVADVRNYPGSKRFPHFNKEALETSLPANQVNYIHFKDLGGRRNPVPGSTNTRWRNSAFRGYADYMETQSFKTAIERLEHLAAKKRTAYMCSEAVWWSCHRSLISDYLKARGWLVMHIMEKAKAAEHPYTSAARIVGGELRYDEPTLF